MFLLNDYNMSQFLILSWVCVRYSFTAITIIATIFILAFLLISVKLDIKVAVGTILIILISGQHEESSLIATMIIVITLMPAIITIIPTFPPQRLPCGLTQCLTECFALVISTR